MLLEAIKMSVLSGVITYLLMGAIWPIRDSQDVMITLRLAVNVAFFVFVVLTLTFK